MLFRARGRIFSTSNATVLNIKQHISVCRISAQRLIYVVPSAVLLAGVYASSVLAGVCALLCRLPRAGDAGFLPIYIGRVN